MSVEPLWVPRANRALFRKQLSGVSVIELVELVEDELLMSIVPQGVSFEEAKGDSHVSLTDFIRLSIMVRAVCNIFMACLSRLSTSIDAPLLLSSATRFMVDILAILDDTR